jgi:hypothetical protein
MRRPSKLAVVLRALAFLCCGCAAFDTSDINTSGPTGDGDLGDGDTVGDGDFGDGDGDTGDGDSDTGDGDSGDGDSGDGDSGDGDSGDGDGDAMDGGVPAQDASVADGGFPGDGGFEKLDGGACDPGSTPLSACIASHCCTERSACEAGWAGCPADEACMAQCVEHAPSGNVAMCTPGCNLENPLSMALATCIDTHCSRDSL